MTVLCTDCGILHSPTTTPFRIEKQRKPGEIWCVSPGVNDRLQSQQFLSTAAGTDLSAAERARLPTVSTQNYNFLLTNSPTVNLGSGVSPSTGLPHYFPALGQNQNDLPISFTFATLPLYTGGKILRDIDAAGHRVATQRNEESRTALDLKLVVAESYVGVLRARRNLEVAKSNVKQLSSFAKDVKARREQGLAIRSDDLAAEVSLRNAQIGEIQAKNALKTAWATYNRYLCRPLATAVDLDELSNVPAMDADWKALAERAMEANSDSMEMNESELDAMTRQAMRRPELASLTSQARTLGAQAELTLSNIRPQVGIGGGFAFLGAVGAAPQGYGAMMLSANWTFTDSGATRRTQRRSASVSLPRSSNGPTWRPTSPFRSGPGGSTSKQPTCASLLLASPSPRPRRITTSSWIVIVMK